MILVVRTYMAYVSCPQQMPRLMCDPQITIEDKEMAVWYFSRSHSAKSPTFNFLKVSRSSFALYIVT